MMPSVGPEGALPLPAGWHILADPGYPPHPVLVRRKKRNKIRGNARLRRINRELRRC
jgi:hypothetical protein